MGRPNPLNRGGASAMAGTKRSQNTAYSRRLRTFVCVVPFKLPGSLKHVRLRLLIGLLWPAAAWGFVVGESAPHFFHARLGIIGVSVDPEPDALRRALAALDFRYPTASDPAADSAIIYAVGTLPAAFIVDVEGSSGTSNAGSDKTWSSQRRRSRP